MVADPAQDPAQYAGPCDFNEKDFHDNVTLYDYASLGYVLGMLPPVVMSSVALHSIRTLWTSSKKSLREAAWESAMLHIAGNCNWPQLRRLCPVRPLREELKLARFRDLPGYNHYFGGENFSARWLVEKPNRKPDDPVILYMHGGSYALKVQRPQLKYLVNLVKEMAPVQVSILIIDYTIGPFAKHPKQLNEGMACYEQLRKSCNNIIFFGDSCGGHMALSMLLSGARCQGLVLVSPSTDMTSDLPEDVHMREVFVDTSKYSYSDPLISPLLADKSIWKNILPARTVVVWGGSEECKQQMKDWAEIAEIEAKFEEPGGSHDCILRGNSNLGSKFIKHHLRALLSGTEPPKLGLSNNPCRNSATPSFMTISPDRQRATRMSTPDREHSVASSDLTMLSDCTMSSENTVSTETTAFSINTASSAELDLVDPLMLSELDTRQYELKRRSVSSTFESDGRPRPRPPRRNSSFFGLFRDKAPRKSKL